MAINLTLQKEVADETGDLDWGRNSRLDRKKYSDREVSEALAVELLLICIRCSFDYL
jgi:hypothetical protein